MFLKNVLTFIVIIILCCSNISLDSGFIQISDMADLLCKLQKLQMFGYTERLSEIQIKHELYAQQLKSHIKTVYNTLRCSYIAEAQNYMNLVETVIFCDNEMPSIDDVEGITFNDPVSRMLATMINVKEMHNTGTKYVMFIFYMYTERIKKHFMAAIAGNSQDLKVISIVHKVVKCFLDKWLSEDDCATFENKAYLEPRPNMKETMENNLRNIKSGKWLTESRLTNNAKHTISDEGSDQFSLKALTLNEVVLNTQVMDKFFDTFPVHVDWDPLMDLLKRQLKNAKRMSGNFLSEQILSLFAYQCLFIQMMKVVIIRLTLKYVMYLSFISCLNDRNQYGKLYNDDVFKRITDFEEFFQLRDDKDLGSLKQIFNTSSFSKSVQYNIQSIQDVLNNISLQVIKNEGLASPMYLSQDLKSPNTSINLLIEDSVSILARFMVHIKQMLFGINFSVIQLFILIPTTKEFQSLFDIEYSHLTLPD